MRTATSPTRLTVFDSISAFTSAAEGMADLRVAKAVDETVDSLCAIAKFYLGHASIGRAMIASIKDRKVVVGEYLDPEGAAETALDAMIQRSEGDLATLTVKKGYIDRDRDLSKAHCDMLHTAYEDALDAMANVIDVAKDMRAAIIAHDMAAEPRNGKTYSDARELFSELRH